MIVVRAILMAFLSVGIAGSAAARTATPTSTPTPVPPAIATPVPPEPADFAVIPWVNGRNSAREVTAKIGVTLCATGHPSFTTGSRPRAIFQLSVPSEEVVPGCGREGAVVTFFVDGQQAPQTAVWHPRAFLGSDQTVQVIIGPPFAHFTGGVGPSRVSSSQVIQPYVGNIPCGYGRAGDPGDAYGAVVYSAEQQAGCGVEGSQITLKLLDAQGNVVAVANEKGTWHAWDGVFEHIQRLDLTFGPASVITMPGTGTGDGPHGEGSEWAGLSILLGFVGLAGAALGLALRRQAMTR